MAHAMGRLRTYPLRNFGKNGAIWCVLMYILIRFYFEKLSVFYIKNNNIAARWIWVI